MLTAVLLAAALAPAADETRLEDVKRFTNDDYATLKARYQTTRFFECFLSELKRNARDEKRKEELDAEQRSYRTTAYTYLELYRVKNPNDKAPEKLRTLRRLRMKIGEAAYKAGGLPPLYPAKYEKEFKAWLAGKFKQGLTTPAMVAKAALAESKQQLERKLREDQEREKRRDKD